jgi:NAD(P)-dependent dehydrogenase (short-subunit alcohol dehydrogenase family)
MNAGWFPDPSGQPGQRYFDDQRWTQHFVPTPPPSAPAPPAVAVAVSSGGGPNHALHAVLDVNLRTAIQLTQAALPGMRQQGWGRAVNPAQLSPSPRDILTLWWAGY